MPAMSVTAEPQIMPIPHGLQAPGTAEAPFERVLDLAALPAGAMTRVTRGDVDLLIAHTPAGLIATEDRCPHMAAPLTLGTLEGCVVQCPLHSGRFDLCTGEPIQFPTTGGLDADGGYHPTWTPSNSPPKPEPTDLKAQARAATRIRRLRFVPLRVRNGSIEVAFPR